MKSLRSLTTQGSSIFFWKFSGYVSTYDPFWIVFKYTARCGLRFVYFSWSPAPFVVKTNLLCWIILASLSTNYMRLSLELFSFDWWLSIHTWATLSQQLHLQSSVRQFRCVCSVSKNVCVCACLLPLKDRRGHQILWAIVTDDGEPTCGCRNTPIRTAGILNHWANSTAPHSAYQTVESSNITLLF